MNDTLSENNDTVGQIVHYIMKNEGMCLIYRLNKGLLFFFFTVINVTFNCTLHTFSTLFHPPSMK